MKRLLPLLFVAVLGCLLPVFAGNGVEELEFDRQFFKDGECSALKEGVKDVSAFKSDAMKAVAERLLKRDYDSAYLLAGYEAFPSSRVIDRTLKLRDGFSKYENMTGVYLEEGEHVLVVKGSEGRKIELLLPNWMRKPAEGVVPDKDPNGWGLKKQVVSLKEGVNVVTVDTPTNAYIGYVADDWDTAPKVTVHFLTGKVNGYFDTTRGDDDAVWNKLLDNAVSPIMDARGKHIQVAYPVEAFKRFTKGHGVELINAYDKLIGIQYEMMGLVKYNKVPKNRVLARVNYNYYMFRDGDGVAYLGNDGTMRMVADPKRVVKGDPCWGFSHEVGHVMQMSPMTWGGMTEVSNNLYSLQATILMGNKSRIKQQNNFEKARKEIIGQNMSYLQSNDVFNRLVPFWQLHLYFTKNGCPDFYGDVMEYLRNNAGNYRGNDTIKYQFEFIKACCAASKTDLTDFFDKWGFFWTGELEIGDYGRFHFKITDDMVKETKDWIAAQGYKKPAADITLTDE